MPLVTRSIVDGLLRSCCESGGLRGCCRECGAAWEQSPAFLPCGEVGMAIRQDVIVAFMATATTARAFSHNKGGTRELSALLSGRGLSMLWEGVMACLHIVVEALTNIAVGWRHRPHDRVTE